MSAILLPGFSKPSSRDWRSPLDPLIEAAIRARENAHAPFSKFKVGAALESGSGTIYTGCNIENASYGLSMCAERVALFKAVSEGERRFRRIAIAADTPSLTPPCGACRQLLWEFCRDTEVILVNLQRRAESYTMHELLPGAFDASFLD